MPARDEQEYERRRAQILDGALQVFSTKGFAEATIKDIAAAAGIGSPGLIYHYFKDKEAVFRQLVEQRIPVFGLVAHPEALMALPPRELLTRLATLILEATENAQTVALMKLVLGIGCVSEDRQRVWLHHHLALASDGYRASAISQHNCALSCPRDERSDA